MSWVPPGAHDLDRHTSRESQRGGFVDCHLDLRDLMISQANLRNPLGERLDKIVFRIANRLDYAFLDGPVVNCIFEFVAQARFSKIEGERNIDDDILFFRDARLRPRPVCIEREDL